ncbi:hypothetical protein [Chryseobacterium sp. ISL-6]|uniref:hypothetical protein n=1 Tax=Chryseobacterium sp. ISL-6 TaxID=2819143 RepID=UPI001BE5A7E6|nr:hypothetical protein [Chryseobacterium sp. ISL-6]MBT2623493.1 hypothetical protein [Chryseobacterium sp. ISL-6]
MKYIIIENKEQHDDELHDDIADFLWNRGNEVFIRNNTAIDFQNIIKYCNYIVLLIQNSSSELHSERDLKGFIRFFELENCQNKKTIFVFSNNGVYSNAIPFPHKIFHFEQLNKNELIHFFSWSNKFNLFNTNKETTNQ